MAHMPWRPYKIIKRQYILHLSRGRVKKIQLLTANIIKNFAQPQSMAIAIATPIAIAMRLQLQLAIAVRSECVAKWQDTHIPWRYVAVVEGPGVEGVCNKNFAHAKDLWASVERGGDEPGLAVSPLHVRVYKSN